MQHADLFMELAGIAGVFVGFGALIAVRSGGPTDPKEVAPIRGAVATGVLTVMAALAPVTLGFFDLTQHQVWALSSALALIGMAVFAAALFRTPEYRAMAAGEVEEARRSSRSRWLVVLRDVVLNALLSLTYLLLPIVILLGVAPDLEAGLYFALVALILLGAAWMLLLPVFAQRVPAGG
jgi:1,4-dihydroxy-2-naphthoate octaprenyltransferase